MARRVNTKFLVIFSVVVLGGVASAFVAQGPLRTWIRGDRSKTQIKTADALVKDATAATGLDKKKLLEDAFRNYILAANSETRNPELYLKLGDVYSQLTQFDLGFIGQSYSAWDKALEIEPTYLPALRRLQDSYYKQAQFGAVATIFSRLQDRATTIHRLDPADVRAHAFMSIAPLYQWLAGIETPAAQVDSAMEDLIKLTADNPTVPEVADMVFYVAMAKAKRGIEFRRLSQDKDGNVLIFEGMKAFQDAIKRNEQSAALHYRFFEMLMFLRRSDAERDPQQRYTEMLKVELDKARRLVTPDDETFVKIFIAAHEVAQSERRGRADNTAETILLDLYKAKPDDQRVRLAVAKMWRRDRDKRSLAIELLEKPMVDTGWVGVEAYLKLDLELQSWGELTNMYIERYSSLAADKKPDELKRIEDTYEKLYAKAHERWDVLKIRGRIELLRGGPSANLDAIKTFEKAQQKFQAERNTEDLDLNYELAKAYMRGGQFGSARIQLLKLKERSPDFVPVRMMLAQVLIREGNTNDARVEVEFMEKQAPEEPDVLRLLLAVLDPAKDAIKVKATFGKLPEANRAEQLSKAQIANLAPVSNPEEAVRLFKLILAGDPADFDALQGAREALTAQDKKDEALALLKAGQKAKPDDKKIGLIIQQLEGASTADIIKLSEKVIREQFADDPYGLELKLYEFHLVASNKQEAFTHLVVAEKLKPDDLRVQDLMFQYYLNERNWDKAGEYVDKLAPKNPDQANGLIYRFRLAMARGDYAAATTVANDLTQQLKEFARSWICLGQALQASKQYESAVGAYNVALERQTDNPEALAGSIACYFQLGKPAEALRYINRGRTAHPTNAFFKNQWMSYQLSQWGDPSQVVKPALDERDANPKDLSRWIALGRAQYAAAQRREKPESPKFIADAKATFTEALKQWPKEMVVWAFLSEIADFNNDTAGGEALLKDMVARPEFINTPEPALMLADHYLRHNAPDQCEATMKKALESFKDFKDPKNANEVRRRLAAFYTQSKKWDQALKLLDPASPDKLVRQQIVEIYMLQAASEKNDPELFGKAEKLVRSMLATSPDDPQLHALLGVVLLNMNQPQRAMESLSTALKLDPRNQAALYSRGQLRLKEKPPQLEGAVQDLTALRDVNPNHIECRISLAGALSQQRHFEDAARELEYALVRAPFRRDIRMTLAGLYAGIKPTPLWNEAERVITNSEKMEPKEVLWKRMLAKLWSARGMHDKATIKIREALDAETARVNALPPAQRLAASQNGEILRDYLDILETAKNWPLLLEEVKRVFEADPKVANTGWMFYIKRAVAKRNTGAPREALADFEKAMQIVEADKTSNQDTLIFVIDKLRQTLSAQDAIDRVTTLVGKGGPQATRWKVVLARLHFINKDYANAARFIEEARAETANLDENQQMFALNVAGTIYMMSGDFPKARSAYEQLLAKRSEDLAGLNNLAFIMAEHMEPPDVTKALSYSQRAFDVMTKNNMLDPNVLDTYGWINVLSGGAKLDIGIDKLSQSISAGELPEAYYHMGEALIKKNLPDIAKTNFTRASELLQAKVNANEAVDDSLRQKVDKALQNVDKVLGSGR